MITKIWNVRSLTLCLLLAFVGTATQVGFTSSRAEERRGELTVTGKVKVNGQPAATGDVVLSGGTVETAKGSSAVVSLGKLGRVEVLPGTRMKLRYDDAAISILLDTGSVLTRTNGLATNVTSRGCE